MNVRALLENGRKVPRVPDAVRERVLARARFTAAFPANLDDPAPLARPRSPISVLAPAAGAVIAGGVVAFVALHGASPGPHGRPAAGTTAQAIGSHGASEAVGTAGTVPPAAPSAAAAPSSAALAASLAKQASASSAPNGRAPAYAAELELMRSAHRAYAAHDDASALLLIAEHARRFPRGVLAEEREALRIRCLLRSGRTSEARRAMSAFEQHFPRSVLRQRLKAEVQTGGE